MGIGNPVRETEVPDGPSPAYTPRRSVPTSPPAKPSRQPVPEKAPS